VVALVEQKVEGLVHCRQPHRKCRGRTDIEERRRCREDLLGAREPLFNRGWRADECGCDFTNAESTQDVKHERHLRIRRDLPIAA